MRPSFSAFCSALTSSVPPKRRASSSAVVSSGSSSKAPSTSRPKSRICAPVPSEASMMRWIAARFGRRQQPARLVGADVAHGHPGLARQLVDGELVGHGASVYGTRFDVSSNGVE
jgi:hypothetical protein